MSTITRTLPFAILLTIYAVPAPVSADVVQNSADIRTSSEPVVAGGWAQELGRGLTGALTGALFPIRLFPVPGGRQPRFEITLDELPGDPSSLGDGTLGSVTWPAALMTITPAHIGEELDTTLSLSIPEDNIRYQMNPNRAYRISLKLSSFMSNGAFQVYGTAEDSYAHGATNASGLADMAFSLFGVDRTDAQPVPQEASPAVSNVLFLPGIKGSRLYREDPACNGCEKLLWEPYSNDAVHGLMLSPTGTSLYDDIYVQDEDIIDEVLGSEFYSSFFASMDTAEADGTYGANWTWKPLAYDWRLSLNDLMSNGVQEGERIYYARATSTPYIEQTLRNLAATSPTGKVTIVAHSNGGLVAKALMRKLGAAESSDLVDDIIFVGVPQIGAPQAIGALLYGYGEALPRSKCADSLVIGWLCGMFVDRSTARAFAENAPMGYHLLPSHTYMRFGASDDMPVVKFNATKLYEQERARYGPNLNTVEELYDYLLAKDNGRVRPAPSETDAPNVLSEQLISYARSLHESLDSWTPSSSMTFHQIAGWGAPTISGVELYEEPRILGVFGSEVPRYRPLFSQDGDGVVPQYSATPLSGGFAQRYWLDLPSQSDAQDQSFSHSNLFEIPTLTDTVHSILTDSSLPDELLTEAPQPQDSRRWRIFMLHSPLTLELYDREGNHVGETLTGFDSDIATVSYGEFGEVKYLIVPADETYTIELNGKDEGSFSLDIQEFEGGKVRTTTLAHIPSTEHTVARMEVGNDIESSILSIDHDGDGSVDATMTPTIGSFSLYDGPPPAIINEPDSPEPENDSGDMVELEPADSASTSSSASDQSLLTNIRSTAAATSSPLPIHQDHTPEITQSEAPEQTFPEVTPPDLDIEITNETDLPSPERLSASAVTAGEGWLARLWSYLMSLLNSLFA